MGISATEYYTTTVLIDRITVAPDTHVIQAGVKPGLIGQEQVLAPDVREHLAYL